MSRERPIKLFRADSMATAMGASVVASALSRVIGLGRSVALAWFISQAQFGLFGVALLIVNILMPFCGAGLYEGVARYAPFHETAGSVRRFAARTAMLLLMVAGGSATALWLLSERVGPLLFSASRTLSTGAAEIGAETAAPLMRVCVVCVVALAAYQTLLGLLKGLRMFRAVGVAEVSTAAGFTVIALVAASSGYATARALIIAYAATCAIGVMIFSGSLFRRLATLDAVAAGAGHTTQSTLVSYSLWAAGTAVLWHALSYYPMWYLLKVSTSETVGSFHAMRLITQLVQIAAAMVAAVLAAGVTRLWERNERETAALRLRALSKASVLALLAGATALSAAKPLVMRLFPVAFAGGRVAYDPLILFFLLVGVIGIIAIRLQLIEKPRRICLAWLAGVAANVVASFLLFSPAAGAGLPSPTAVLRAAAWANVAGAKVALLVVLASVRRQDLRVDKGTLISIAACIAAGFGWAISLPVLVVVLIIAMTTDFFFSLDERSELRRGVFAGQR